ncbi:mitochondrial intermediate peptidase [Physcia stellaris]|nr:mitochondrial intermediate peptidase [Physcia stellaris]
MLRSACRASWNFSLRHRQRNFSTAGCVLQQAQAATASTTGHISKASDHDDQTLRQIFDSHHVWSAFSNERSSRPRTGLFQNQYLKDASGFRQFASVTLARCQKIVAKVLEASSVKDYQETPGDLDRLSDSLCRVLDLSDFVRSTHPDARFREAADEAYQVLYEYMNVLNTTPGLEKQLKRALADPKVTEVWTEEEKSVAQILLKDFSKSAIHLPEDRRQRFVSLSSDISRLGSTFVAEMAPEKSTLVLNGSKAHGINPNILGQMTDRRGRVHLPTVGSMASLALRSVHDEATRREIYITGRTSAHRQIRVLESLMQQRAELARLSGYQSYAEMNTSDKMAKSPAAITSFLSTLSQRNMPIFGEELQEMAIQKKKDIGEDTGGINAWDREYYRSRLASQIISKSRKPDFISAYFSLGTVMQGLSRLFTCLYGIRFVPQETRRGETWNPDVRRLDVFDETEGHIATVYCDLFARVGKSPNPAHFTLRCSREITSTELAESAQASPEADPIVAANDGMPVARSPTTGVLYQLPVIALICDFSTPNSLDKPALLSFRDVQTLFHEMGHAIHSIIGRTSLQVVSGTRCATDFAELPSVLMEHFAADATVLSLFARHWETDAPLPFEMVAERLAIDRKGQGADTEHQILLAMLDQAYHSPLAAEPGFDSTKIFHDVFARYSSLPEPATTTAQGFFGHLVEYGGTYYSYLFDRAIAGKIWQEVFGSGDKAGAVARENGERFRQEVLRWGGSRDGWKCVAGALGDPSIAEGGAGAMEEVGRWGVKD